MALFLCAAAGNLTYTLGILLNPNQNRQTMLEAIPYILGSAGTLVFDVTIYIQHAVYSRHTEEKTYPTTNSILMMRSRERILFFVYNCVYIYSRFFLLS